MGEREREREKERERERERKREIERERERERERETERETDRQRERTASTGKIILIFPTSYGPTLFHKSECRFDSSACYHVLFNKIGKT